MDRVLRCWVCFALFYVTIVTSLSGRIVIIFVGNAERGFRFCFED